MLHMVLNCLLGGNPNPQQKSLPQQKISIKATLRFKETLSVNQPFSPATAASQASLQETTRFGSGQAVKRLEDQQLLLGAGVFANDVSLPQQTHLVFLRSPYPHAHITRLDTSAAKAMPGVHYVLTGQDLQNAGVKPMARPMNFKRADGSPLSSTTRHVLAVGTVRFVGEPIAAVVADSELQARDAAEAIEIEFEALASATRLADALSPNAPLLTEAPDNRVAETRYGSAEATQAAFDQAAHVVHLDIVNQRLAALSIDCLLYTSDAADEAPHV
jgi:carbon-monoxide dehydrogenase large subunit